MGAVRNVCKKHISEIFIIFIIASPPPPKKKEALNVLLQARGLMSTWASAHG